MKNLELIKQEYKNYDQLTDCERSLVNHDFDVLMMGNVISFEHSSKLIEISMNRINLETKELIMSVRTYKTNEYRGI